MNKQIVLKKNVTYEKAFENDDHMDLMNLTTKKIQQIKYDIFREMGFSQEEILDFMSKLKQYRYVDSMNEIKVGNFVRWIDISVPDSPTFSLNRGAIVAEVKVVDDGISLLLKTFDYKYFQIELDKNLIFQKLSAQESVILSALDHVNNDA